MVSDIVKRLEDAERLITLSVKDVSLEMRVDVVLQDAKAELGRQSAMLKAQERADKENVELRDEVGRLQAEAAVMRQAIQGFVDRWKAKDPELMQYLPGLEQALSSTSAGSKLLAELRAAREALEAIRKATYMDSADFERERLKTGLVHTLDTIQIIAREALDAATEEKG